MASLCYRHIVFLTFFVHFNAYFVFSVSPGSAEAHVGWGGNLTVVWLAVVSEIFVPEIIKIC